MSNDYQRNILSPSLAATLEIGRRIGQHLRAGDTLALVGPLGAGKTHLVKGIGRGLDISDAAITSPTFVLVNEYRGRLPVLHLDAYRLRAGDELEALGFDEMLTGGAVVLVEWADRVADAMPDRALWIDISVAGENSRRLQFRTTDAGLAARIDAAIGQSTSVTSPTNSPPLDPAATQPDKAT